MSTRHRDPGVSQSKADYTSEGQHYDPSGIEKSLPLYNAEGELVAFALPATTNRKLLSGSSEGVRYIEDGDRLDHDIGFASGKGLDWGEGATIKYDSSRKSLVSTLEGLTGNLAANTVGDKVCGFSIGRDPDTNELVYSDLDGVTRNGQNLIHSFEDLLDVNATGLVFLMRVGSALTGKETLPYAFAVFNVQHFFLPVNDQYHDAGIAFYLSDRKAYMYWSSSGGSARMAGNRWMDGVALPSDIEFEIRWQVHPGHSSAGGLSTVATDGTTVTGTGTPGHEVAAVPGGIVTPRYVVDALGRITRADIAGLSAVGPSDIGSGTDVLVTQADGTKKLSTGALNAYIASGLDTGNRLLPSGGTQGQVVRKTEDGVGWGDDDDTPTSYPASDVTLDASGFGHNLKPEDTDVQKAAQRMNDLVVRGSAGLTVSSGVANCVALSPSGNITADRQPGHTAYGTFTGDIGDTTRTPWQLHLDTSNGNLTAVMKGSVSDYAGDNLNIGDNHVAFDDAQSVDTTIQPGTTGAEFVWHGDYSTYLTAGANAWAVKIAIRAEDIETDDTLTGTGKSTSPLGVANPFTQVDEDRLDSLGGEAFTELYEGTVTAVLNVADTEAQRTPGQTAVGSFTGDSELLRVHIDGSTGNLTLVLEGTEADYTGNRFRLGGRHVAFDDRQIVSPITASRVEYEFSGDRSDWLTAGTAEDWAVLEPVDPFVSASIDGNALTLTTESGVSVVVHIPGRPDPITKLPVPLVTNRLYNLTTADTIDQSVQSAAVLRVQNTQRYATVNQNGFNGVRGYTSTYSGPSAATVRDRTVLSFHVGQDVDNPPVALFIGTALGGQTRHDVTTAVIPNFGHSYLVANTFGYGDLSEGTRYWINVQYQDGTFLFPPTAIAAGVWLATGPRTLIHAPGYPESWAEVGSGVDIPPEKFADGSIPDSKLAEPSADWTKAGMKKPVTAGVKELASNQTGPSIVISNSGQTAYSSAQTASPAFDMDDSDKTHGVVEMQFSVALSRKSNNTIAFKQAANQDQADDASSERDDGFTTITELKATPVFAPSTANGVEIGNAIPIYQGVSKLGSVQFYLTRDADNNLSWHFVYTGEAATSTFDITSTVSVFFQYADPPDTESAEPTFYMAKKSTAGEFTAAEFKAGRAYRGELPAWFGIPANWIGETTGYIGFWAPTTHPILDIKSQGYQPSQDGIGNSLDVLSTRNLQQTVSDIRDLFHLLLEFILSEGLNSSLRDSFTVTNLTIDGVAGMAFRTTTVGQFNINERNAWMLI